MDEQPLESIKEFLRQREVQERIYQHIRQTRSQITVPIGRVVSLLGLSENRLRKWEDRGLLHPLREGTHRLYTFQDLDRLAIIRELIDAQFSPGNIPPDIDKIWAAITASDRRPELQEHDEAEPADIQERAGHQHINQRIEHARQDLFWRYYASQALRLSLQLVRESLPGTKRSFLGLILPLNVDTPTFESVTLADQLPAVRESLVGWLASSGSSHTLLTPAPSFEHPSRYWLYQLRTLHDGVYNEEDRATDHTFLLVEWTVNKLTVQSAIVQAIRRLLEPLYANGETIRACFDQGWRDQLEPATDLGNEYPDLILNGLANMVIRLGRTGAGQQKWRFCCILTPNDSTLPLQRRSLVVRAQSSEAMHMIGKTLVSPTVSPISLSLRAFQGGQTVYRPEIYKEDLTIAFLEMEEPVSAIAVPVEGENNTPSAVLYVVADKRDAFDAEDQHVLRLVGRMVQDTLAVYNARRQAASHVIETVVHAQTLDPFFERKRILSENDFMRDVETLLQSIQEQLPERQENSSGSTEPGASFQEMLSSTEAISIISLEIDQQTNLAGRYGDQFAQNLSRVVGSHLQTQLPRIFTELVSYKLYYIYAGRFYVLLDKLSLEEARKHAERIRRKLNDAYEVSILQPVSEEVANTDPETKYIVTLSVHVGVSSYTRRKLEDLLQRYSTETAAGNVASLINRDIDIALNKGRREGGNMVISWNPAPDKRGYIRWSAP